VEPPRRTNVPTHSVVSRSRRGTAYTKRAMLQLSWFGQKDQQSNLPPRNR
jgi:hypothetical protein